MEFRNRLRKQRIHFVELTLAAAIPSLFLQRRALCPESTFGDFYWLIDGRAA